MLWSLVPLDGASTRCQAVVAVWLRTARQMSVEKEPGLHLFLPMWQHTLVLGHTLSQPTCVVEKCMVKEAMPCTHHCKLAHVGNSSQVAVSSPPYPSQVSSGPIPLYTFVTFSSSEPTEAEEKLDTSEPGKGNIS